MTDEEYFALVSTFRLDFEPSVDTCIAYAKKDSELCRDCSCSYNERCGVSLKVHPENLIPEFYKKVLQHHPENLL